MQVNINKKVLWSHGCIKQWAEDLRTVFPRTLIEMRIIRLLVHYCAKKCSDNIHSVDNTKVGFQKLPRSDL